MIFIRHFGQLVGQIQVIPANDRVFDQTAAVGGDVLQIFLTFGEFLIVGKSDGFGKAMRVFDFIKLLFDCPAQFDIINVWLNGYKR